MDEAVVCVVEIPRGSRNKYEWDEGLERMRLDRYLASSMACPADYGYVPGTAGADGEPLDVFVAVSEPTFPGCAVEARPLGLVRIEFQSGPEEKVICVPCGDPEWERAERLDDLPDQLRRDIGDFFASYKAREGKPARVTGWADAAAARRLIEESRISARG